MNSTSGHYRRLWLLLLGASGVAAAYGCQSQSGTETAGENAQSAQQADSAGEGEIHGYVYVGTSQPGGGTPVPDLDVYFTNTTSSQDFGPVLSDADGRIVSPRLPAGTYQVCIDGNDQYYSNCYFTDIVLGGGTVVLRSPLYAPPRGNFMYGRASFTETGSRCFSSDQEFNVLQTSTAKLLDASERVVAGPVRANSSDTYVFARAPGAGNYTLVVACGSAEARVPVTLSTDDLAGKRSVDGLITNRMPKNTGAFASVGGTFVKKVPPGTTVRIDARIVDPDGDALTYAWSSATGTYTSSNAPIIDWALPAVNGVHIMRVKATDTHGAIRYVQVPVSTGPNDVLFTGTVDAPNTTVTVNGAPAAVGTDRRFAVSVPNASRYVVNARAPGRALVSRIAYSGATQMAISLPPSETTPIDAQRGGLAGFHHGEQQSGSCVALICEQHPASCDCTTRPCNPKPPAPCEYGASVEIPANALVEQDGSLYVGTARVSVAQYNLSDASPIPGDLGGIENGVAVAMGTLGAIEVTPYDFTGTRRLQLRPGQVARVRMAAPRTGTRPPVVSRLWYDESSGLWINNEAGKFTHDGSTYFSDVTHFTAFNADSTFTNPACIKLTMDDQMPLPRPFKLRVSYRGTLPQPQHNDFLVNEEDINAVFRLPANTQVTIEAHPASGPDTILNDPLVVDSGAAIDPTFNGVPPKPYDACRGTGTIRTSMPAHASYLDLKRTRASQAQDYYQALGVLGGTARDTFDHWKTTNGFPDANEKRVVFYNRGDFGVGQDVHCRSNAGHLSCYLTMHGMFGGPSDTALDDAAEGDEPLAALAMEYDPSADPKHAVQFYAYNADGTALLNPTFDSGGGKNVPGVCLACHGGYYDRTQKKVAYASFLPFDVASTSHYVLPLPPSPLSRDKQEEAFRSLNAMVLDTHPNSDPANQHQPIAELVGKWYPCDVHAQGCVAHDTSDSQHIPAGWTGNLGLYANVIQPYCRSCHLATGDDMDFTSLSGTSAFSSHIETTACNSTVTIPHTMPHSEASFRAFWLSTDPSAPAYLTDAGIGVTACPRR